VIELARSGEDDGEREVDRVKKAKLETLKEDCKEGWVERIEEPRRSLMVQKRVD
jgi:hypothetical protein